MNAPVFRCFDIMLHVPDEQRLRGLQSIFFEDFMNFFALVPDADVGLVEIFIEPGNRRLHREMILMDRAQEKGAQVAGAAELEEITRVRQFADRILDLFEAAVEPGLQLRQRHMRNMTVVKNRERQAELGSKLFEAHLRALGLF